MASNYQTLQEFPREFHLAWEVAASGDLRLEFPTRGTATNFKARMYQYRKRLREQDLAAAARFDGIDLQVLTDGEKGVVTNTRIDWKSQLLAQAKASGLGELPLPSSIEPPSQEESPTSGVDSQSELLRQMGFTSGKE
jgi:hypothetical protein